MRNAIAAGFAALIVVAAAVLGWQAVSSRVAPDEATPTAPIDALVSALAGGPDGDVAAVVRSGGEELAAAVEAVDAGLPSATWKAERSEVEVEDARATATVSLTLATADLGEISWDTTVEATRIRGVWGMDVSSTTLHPDLRPGYKVVVERTEMTRASLLAHDGEPLTTHGTAWSIGIAPGQVVNEERLLSTWEAVLPTSLGDLQELLERNDTNPTWFYPVVTITEDRYEEIWPRLRGVPGVIARDAEDATPTEDDFASHVLGRVGEPTAEQIEELGVSADQVVGLRGLERVFEDRLVGSEEAAVLIVQPDGDPVTELARTQEDASGPVTTTLDRTVQQAVENALTAVEAPIGVVVVDTATGAIRASASRPLTGYNRAFEGNYPPGDAFLPVTAEALFAGDLILREPATCPAEDAVAGAQLQAPRDLPETTIGQALAAGCDTTLGALAARALEPGDLVVSGERFGFGAAYELPLPVAGGSLPEPVDTTELVRAAVGQARVQASPLHMATVAAAAATGTWHAPFLLVEQEGEGPSTALAGPAREDLVRLFELGAADGGSGASFRPADGQGFVGTAPVTGSEAIHAWAVGITGELAFAVVAEDTGGDPAPAKRVAEQFLRELQALRR